MKHTNRRQFFTAAILLAALLLSAGVRAQPVGTQQYYDALPLRTANVIATRNGDIISVFLLVHGAPPTATYATVIQRTDNRLTIRWSKLYPGFALSAIFEAANGDFVFSGTEQSANGNIASIIRTTGTGALVWRYNATTSTPLGGASYPGAEQRLAETRSGKIYFHFLGPSRNANEYTATCLQASGSLVWIRQLAYPTGFAFTDMTSTFDGNMLLSGSLSGSGALGSAIALIDSAARLVVTRRIGDGSRLHINQILKDSARRQYVFCGEFTDRFGVTKAMVCKAGADVATTTSMPAGLVTPVLFKCRESPKTYGIDVHGSVYCLYANRNGISNHRKVYDGPTANIQVPMVKLDSNLNVRWRKRYLLPTKQNLVTRLASSPQLLLMNDKLIAGLETNNDIPRGSQNISTGWLLITDTLGGMDACMMTPEPFTAERTSFTAADIRGNFVVPTANVLTASSTLNESDYALTPGSGCTTKRVPRAIFSYGPATNPGASPPVVCKGVVLSFLDSSAGEPETWQWIFPREADMSAADSTSCFPNIYNVSFSQTGTFAVTLIVKNSYGSDTLTKYITVADKGDRPDLGPDKGICPGDSVRLVYNDAPLNSHVFTQVGGSFISTADTVFIKVPGTYVVTVISPCGTQRDTIVIKPAARPTADFVPLIACGNLTVRFTDQSVDNGNAPLTYQWQFLDNNNTLLGTSSQQTPSFTYTAYDSVTAKLVVTGPLACTTPDTVKKKFLLRQKPTVSFTFAEQCGSLQASFAGQATTIADSVIAYNWNFGDGGLFSGPQPTVTYAYLVPTVYYVQLRVTTKSGCVSNPVGQWVTIRTKPVADFTYGNDACEGTPFTLTDSSTATGSTIAGYWWSRPSSGQTFTTSSIQPVMAQAGPVVFLHAVTSAQGCASDTVRKTILVESIPVATITANDGCEKENFSFTSTATTSVGSITNYQWMVSNGLTSSQQNPAFTFPSAGVYTVKHQVSTGNGCTSNEAVKTINVFPLPQPSFTHTLGCLNTPVSFTNTTPAAAGHTWQWRIGNTVFSTAANPTYRFITGGTYTVLLDATTTNGCKAAATKTILVDDFSLQLTVSPNPVVEDIPVTFSTSASTPYTVLSWQPATAFTRQDAKGQRLLADSTLPVTVIAQSPAGCRDTATALLEVKPLNDIYVPSAFTPNNDGRNDVLRVAGNVAEMSFSVFNRWGQEVFRSRNKADGWDGTVRGQLQASGTYVYFLKAKRLTGQSIEKKGTILLIR